MFGVQISLLIVIFLSLILRILSLMQTTKEVIMWSVTFFFFFFLFLCHLLNVDACICHIAREGQVEWPHHTIKMLHLVLFHSVTCYTNSIVSHIHVNTTKLRNFTCTLVATGVILWSLECTAILEGSLFHL